jgi:LmbE family N-acetylglucosaminyl deacetylase
MKPSPTSPELPPLLAFGAHPDDIEFGCGGVIARETQGGRRAHFVVGSRGEAGTHGTAARRTAEARAAARRLGATIEFLNLGGDAHFAASVRRVLRVAAIIRRVRPAVVLAPTPVENQHPDHAVLGRMVRDAARLARYGGVRELRRRPPHAIAHLLFYTVAAGAEPAGVQPVLIDVSDPAVLTAWHEAMQLHRSQVQTHDYAGSQMARAMVNGRRAGVGFAIALYPNDPLVFDSLTGLGRSARRL